MEEKSLQTALDIYAALVTGQTVSATDPETKDLYDAFYGDAAVYDITTALMKKLNLSLYEYNDALYMTAGDGNRVFGYTNEDMKRILGLKLNRELYMTYYVMYNVLLLFYRDSASYQVKEYVKTEEILEQVTSSLATVIKDLAIYSATDIEKEGFRSLALLWDELPVITGEERDRNKASRASRTGYVKLTMNFMIRENLFAAVQDRYYPTDRFKALAENYFEEYKGRLYQVLGGEKDA